MKNIVVTGASSGIGRAVAERFVAQGWRVGALARRKEMLDEMDGAVPIVCDVTDSVRVDEAFAEFGQIDVLFNNAGIHMPALPIDEVPVDEWRRVVDVNLTGMFLCARAAFGQMRRQDPRGGRIINNGSISAQKPREGFVAYTATKHAITGLTKSVNLDGRDLDIVCGQIDIGNARTPMVEDIVAAALADGRPEPPTMDVSHVVDAVWSMANLPLSTNVLFQTIMANKMPYVGRG